MKRDFLEKLRNWAKSDTRVPLLVKGARQVGKSWLIDTFGAEFKHYVAINFDKQKSIKQLFSGDVDIKKCLERLTLYTGMPIIPGETLLFLDEIQECEDAITYLRYFKEEYPQLHVIAAGSLIEFALQKVGMPVGRVEYLYLTPLSFGEYLTACGRGDLRECTLNRDSDPLLDELLKEHLRTYMWLGGMPAVVDAWLKYKDVQQCQAIQDRIISVYRDDFEKYSKKNQIDHIESVFKAIPLKLSEKFVFTHVNSDVRADALKKALLLLEKAGIANICYYTSGQSPPLGASINEKFFKVYYLDIGLAQRLLGTTHQDWLISPIDVDNLGGLAEQLVAQEFIAYRSSQTKAELFYWHREAKSSTAEIDFVTTLNSTLVPIEVKAGRTGRLKSLRMYLEEHPNAKYGVKISERGFNAHKQLLEIPLYAVEGWLKAHKELESLF